MKRPFQLLFAAVLTASAALAVEPIFAAEVDQVVPTTQPSNLTNAETNALQLPPGIHEKDLNVKEIKNRLGAVVNEAMTRNGLNGLTGYLVNADRDRLREDIKNAKISNDDLNDRITSIQNAFKTKYGQTFDVDVTDAYTDQFVIIKTGEIDDPNQLSGHWPPAASPSMQSAQGANPNAAQPGASQVQPDKYFGGPSKLDKGRNVALAYLPALGPCPSITVSLLHEMPASWRLDIPDTISGQLFHDNLLTTLTYINDHQAQWPSDVNEAYRHISHAILGSLYGVTPGNAVNDSLKQASEH